MDYVSPILCFIVVFIAAICLMAAVGANMPDHTPQEQERQQKQSEELMGELLWQEKFDRDNRRKTGRR